MYRMGVDVGGTFTDFALIGSDIGASAIHKQLTTPADPSAAVLEGVASLTQRHGIPVSALSELVHGTTLVTNAIIERKGARTGLLVTRGFADLPDIGTEERYDLFDLRIQFAQPLVPRACRREITERTHYDRRVEIPIDMAEVRAAIADLIEREQIEALAVCFLHAYANPSHEDAVRDLVAAEFPHLQISTSSDVFPYLREFERWTTTMANAYTQPIFHRYLQRLEDGLAAQGFCGQLYLMSSSGGIVSPETARRYPVRMLESGPAAGVLMCAEHGRGLGIDSVLAFDLGGTTAKGALVRGGRPLRNYAMEVARSYHHKRGSGLRLKLPVIDMTEIGAGGGSIASVDDRQLLCVGPHSAGASPGPACYGLGGQQATLTDANLVLGYLDAGFFLGGDMALDMRLARDAIIRDVASPLSLEGLRAAWGIHEVINEDIARAFRIHAVERGFDCRRATIVAFGGGGPIHGTAVARKLKAPRVLFPVGAGVMSALGLLYSPMMFEVARSLRVGLAELTAPRFAEIIDGIVAEAVVFLSRAGLAPSDIVTEARVDMRYRGQGYELEIVLPADVARATVLAELPAMFVARYREVFRVDGLDEPLEIISWKAEARGPAPMPPAIAAPSKASGGANGLKGYRDAFFSANAPTRTPVIDRYALRPGDTVVGPGIVEERESTCVLRPGDRAVVDEHYNLVVEVSP
jgi:N-methylhydantoinase A